MINRMRRAVMLDGSFYEEAEHDTSLNQEALIIVIIVALAGGVGALIGGLINGNIGAVLLAALVTVVLAVVNYYIWSYVTYFVGTRFFGGTADPGELLRVIGYAYTPQLLGLLSFIPCVGPFISWIGMILSLIAVVVALRAALDFETGKAIGTAIIGWIIIFVINMVVGLIFGTGAALLSGLQSAG